MLTRLLGYQQITSLSAAVGFTSVPAGAAYARIQAETQDVRWRDDGVDPTASVGVLLRFDSVIEYEGSLSAIRFIQTTPTAIVNATFYGYQDVSLVGEVGDLLSLVAGDDYYNIDGRALEWSSDVWPDITGAAVTLRISTGATPLSVAGTVVTAGIGVAQSVRFELSDTNTSALNAGGHTWEVTYTKGTSTIRLIGALCQVQKAVV